MSAIILYFNVAHITIRYKIQMSFAVIQHSIMFRKNEATYFS